MSFDVGATPAVGAAPSAIASGDLDGDGNADLVVANSSSNTVSVLLGHGDGTFAPQVTYATGSFPYSVVLGKFNNDASLDIVVVNRGDFPSTVSVLLGNGNGTFQAQNKFTVGHSARTAVVADFNGDTKLDLAVTNAADDTISVLLGVGDGTFAPQVTYSTGQVNAHPESLAVAMFDSQFDLAVINVNVNTLSILRGNGNGTFQTAVPYSTGGIPGTLAVANFNGKPGIAVPIQSGGVRIFLGNGDGTFQAGTDYPTGGSAFAIATGDFNADSIDDVAVVNNDFSTTNSSVSILLGNSVGTLQAQVPIATVQATSFVAAGVDDFKGHGQDLAVVDSSHNNVLMLLNLGRIFANGFDPPPDPNQCPPGMILLPDGTCGIP